MTAILDFSGMSAQEHIFKVNELWTSWSWKRRFSFSQVYHRKVIWNLLEPVLDILDIVVMLVIVVTLRIGIPPNIIAPFRNVVGRGTRS